MQESYCRDCGTHGLPRRRGSNLTECLLAAPALILFVLTMLATVMSDSYGRPGFVEGPHLPAAVAGGLLVIAILFAAPAVLYAIWRRMARPVCPACRGKVIPADSPIARAELAADDTERLGHLGRTAGVTVQELSQLLPPGVARFSNAGLTAKEFARGCNRLKDPQ